MRYYIISQPKAGTYLTSNLLVEFGLYQTGIHASRNGSYQHYDLTDPDARNRVPHYTRQGTLPDIVNSLPDQGFAVGHVQYTAGHVAALQPCKKILVTRPYQDIPESFERWSAMKNHKKMSFNQEHYNRIASWMVEPDVFCLNFYDMIERNTLRVDQLQEFLFGEIRYHSGNAIEGALNAPSLTKSPIRT